MPLLPDHFDEENNTLRKPPGWTDEQCMEIPAHTNGTQVITCWRPTSQDRVRLAMGERVYLLVAGATMPPVALFVGSPWEQPGDLEHPPENEPLPGS